MYRPPRFLLNKHLETIYPALFREVAFISADQVRIETADEDFLDLDIYSQHSKNLVIISHGLEGNSSRAYVKGMAKAFYENQFDVVAWNYRGCGEELNKAMRFYHSGATDDLNTIVEFALKRDYKKIFLIGFSLGGNLTLKFAGERTLDERIKGLTVFSVPLNLDSSCTQISKASNWIYSYRFLRSLKKKVKAKAIQFPQLDLKGIDEIDNLRDFDNRYTGPLHGFKNADDYYRKCSSIYFLEGIRIPTLIVNAKNDPFLSSDCFPENNYNPLIVFEFPKYGGHVGFTAFNEKELYWSEQRALEFLLPLAK